MSQAAINFCGLGYYQTENNGTLVDNFNRVECAAIRKVELTPSTKVKIQYWNRTVHLWLKYNVFLRFLGSKNKFVSNKRAASLITFMISAFWHGFYPNYYLFFFQFYLLEQISDVLQDKLKFFDWVERKNLVIQQIIG